MAATGHMYGEWTQVRAATTEETGLEERVCSCGDKEQRELPKLEPQPTESQPSETKPTTPDTKPIVQPTTPEQEASGTTDDASPNPRDDNENTKTIVAVIAVLGGIGIGGIGIGGATVLTD